MQPLWNHTTIPTIAKTPQGQIHRKNLSHMAYSICIVDIPIFNQEIGKTYTE